MSTRILKYQYFRRHQLITNEIWMSSLPGGGQRGSPAINKPCLVLKLKAQIQRLSNSQEKNPTFSACKLHPFLHKNLLLETDGSLQDLQILCLEWQTRPYCPSKSTVTLWSTDPNKSIMFLSTTMLNQTKWVRLNRKGWGILNPFPLHPRKNNDRGRACVDPSLMSPAKPCR